MTKDSFIQLAKDKFGSRDKCISLGNFKYFTHLN